MTRLFVALWPPDHVVDVLLGLHRKDERDARFISPENWHVSLRFLGDAEPTAVTAALDRAHLEPVTARMGPAVDVMNERVLIAPVAGIDQLAAAVSAATRDLGTEPLRKRFHGHISLARLRRNGRNVPRTLGAMIQAEWAVDEIALVQSTLHPDGARYHTLETWTVPTGS